MVELPESSRTGLFVPPDRAHGVAAVGAGQVVAVLGGDAGQGGGQIIAQGEPIGIFLPREDAFIGAVNVGQEFAQRLDRFNGRSFQGIKAVGVVDACYFIEHRFAGRHFSPEIIAKALGRFGLRAAGWFFWWHGLWPFAFVTAPCNGW